MNMKETDSTELPDLDWDKGAGLLPVVVQDPATLQILMLGYMNREALATTRTTRRVTFYSRSKQRLWTKGESSGNFLDVVSIEADCDNDTLLVMAHPRGPTCHLGRGSCFPTAPGTFIGELDALIAERERERPFNSYTTQLFEQGIRRIAQKVGEEGVETAIAGVAQNDAELLNEAADLIYHLIVLLRARELSVRDVLRVLEDRHRE
ncbi:MAG: bifunctional phosphoribosyl-AMP cyclohydrolase/phosphoribosyl-ATP diphosphatase HisIE [Xanthomonadaceae bacterium]|jgi:phosphoribosyl-ATP pyrophosphohydrolase/phosphoribosyl-AMP cyclohydrolase|nr:bifunctional phosphoribosyl-AMP cyclohydrolase/phosphoribosyl-ATP diphosphatase HisIE [Xanthomonadaceae bacterium]